MATLPDCPNLTVIYNPALPNRLYDLPTLAAQHAERISLVTATARPFRPAEQWQFFNLARQHDLWHAPYYIRPYILPIPSVLTAYDVTSAKIPSLLPSLKNRFAFSLTTRLAFGVSRRIIAISKSSANDIQELYGVKPSKLKVVPLAVGDEFQPLSQAEQIETRKRLGLPARYLLYAGINKPHKNLGRLLEAFQLYQKNSQDDLTLILAGREDQRYAPALHQKAAQLGLKEKVRFWGAVSDADLRSLYACASLFVFPSQYEGFGLPILEAMACGSPVVCANNSSLPEVAGEAALLFEADSTIEIADAIAQGLAQAQSLRPKSLAQAAKFSWKQTAKLTLQVYQETIHK